MQIPKYVQNILRTKQQCEMFAQHPRFCRSIIASFRFLIEDHGFNLSQIAQQRHELWLTFTKLVPIPLGNPKHLDTYVDVTVETECFISSYGRISLHSKRQVYPALRSFSFDQIHDNYSSTANVSGNKLDDQLDRISNTAELMEINWNDIVHRLTRNIPSRKIEG